MQKSRFLAGTAIAVGVLAVLFFYSAGIEKGKEAEAVPQVEKEAAEERKPEYRYISELISIRDRAEGKPEESLLMGERVEILERIDGWAQVENERVSGWVEENRLTEVRFLDSEIDVVVKGEDGEQVSVDVREAYKLGNLQFAPIERSEYRDNPRIDNRAVYISLSRMGRLDDYIRLAHETNINTFVMDVKDDKGRTLFDSPTARNALGENYIRSRYSEVGEIVKKLKENNIYIIGRVSTFKDEALTKSWGEETIVDRRSGSVYISRDTMPWMSPYSRNVWKYNVDLAKEAADLGFNEISFDYVRFPSGVRRLEAQDMLDYRNDYNETKPEAIQRFLKYARDELSKKKVYVNASVFGQVGLSKTDENIGQYWEGVANVVDVISPMAYPSHYAMGTLGIRNPDKEPFMLMDRYAEKIAERSGNLESAGDTNVWIQGFSAPWLKEYRVYREEELMEQIEALRKNELDNYLVWNAASNYFWNGFKSKAAGEIQEN